MAFGSQNPLDSIATSQFGVRKPNLDLASGRNRGMNLLQNLPSQGKSLFDDDDSETSMYLNNAPSNLFRTDREMSSASPSQLANFASNFQLGSYHQGSAMSNAFSGFLQQQQQQHQQHHAQQQQQQQQVQAAQQRSFSNPLYQRNNQTPTCGVPTLNSAPSSATSNAVSSVGGSGGGIGNATSTTFPSNFPQQSSPSRTLLTGLGVQRSLAQNPSQPSQGSFQKPKGILPMPTVSSGAAGTAGSGLFNVFQQQQQQQQPRPGSGGESMPGHHQHQQNTLDLSEFPSLISRNPVSTGSSSVSASKTYVGAMNKQSGGDQQEFSIQEEDFPSLPGSQAPSSVANSNQVNMLEGSLKVLGISPPAGQTVPAAGSYEQALKESKQAQYGQQQQSTQVQGQAPGQQVQGQTQQPSSGQVSQGQAPGQGQHLPPTDKAPGSYGQPQQQQQVTPGAAAVAAGAAQAQQQQVQQQQQLVKRGIQTFPDGRISNIPSGMVMDQFGMVGILSFIRSGDVGCNMHLLTPGVDLTTLGLDLNSQDNLYSTFLSPWADVPCRPQDIDFHVPSEYITNMFIREKLGAIRPQKYSEDLLFFLFYMCCGDMWQITAAAELYQRDWRYHKDERVWITRAPGMEPLQKTQTFERGMYYYFDVANWRKAAKEFTLEYDKLEDRPPYSNSAYQNLPNALGGVQAPVPLVH